MALRCSQGIIIFMLIPTSCYMGMFINILTQATEKKKRAKFKGSFHQEC